MADDHIFEESGSDDLNGDSGILDSTPPPGELLKVYAEGPVTVFGFGGRDVPDEVSLAGYRDQVYETIGKPNCTTVAFDLTGVKMVPSGMLGLMTSVKQRGRKVELYNTSADVKEVLRIACLFDFFDLREVEFDQETNH